MISYTAKVCSPWPRGGVGQGLGNIYRTPLIKKKQGGCPQRTAG